MSESESSQVSQVSDPYTNYTRTRYPVLFHGGVYMYVSFNRDGVVRFTQTVTRSRCTSWPWRHATPHVLTHGNHKTHMTKTSNKDDISEPVNHAATRREG